MSIEQLQSFHQVRRILRAIAPDYRLLASTELPEGMCAIDVRPQQKTIEVSEGMEINEAVAVMLFQIGHLLQRKNENLSLFFGKGFSQWSGSEEDLIKNLSEMGVYADNVASTWAIEVFESYWPIKPDQAKHLVQKQTWSIEQWAAYFSGKSLHKNN